MKGYSPAVLTISGVLLFFSLYLTGPVWPLFLQSRNLDTASVGLIMGLYGLTLVASRIPIGILANRAIGSRRFLVTAGFAAIAIGMVGVVWSGSSPEWLAFDRVLMGVGAGFFVPLVILYAAFFPAASLTKSMGRSAAFFGLGQIPAHSLGGFLADSFGMEIPFWVSAAVAIFAAWFVTTISEPVTESNKREVATSKTEMLYVSSILMAVSFFVVFATVYTLTPLYADSTLKVSETVQGLLLTTYLIVFVVVVLNVHRLADSVGILEVASVGLVFVAASAVLTPFSNLPLLFLSEMLLGAGLGLTWGPLMALSVRDISPEQRFGAMGIFQSIYAVGMFSGPAISGQVAQYWGLASAFFLNGAVVLVALACVVLAKRSVQKPVYR